MSWLSLARAPAWLPTQCAVCRGWGRARVCSDCQARYATRQARCAVCAARTPQGSTTCGACLHSPPPFVRSVAAVDYAFPWRGLIAAFKFHQAIDLADSLSELLARAVRDDDGAPPSLLLPVPLSVERLAERGANQAWELARRVGRQLGIEARPQVLRRLVDTPHLAQLPREQRAAAIRGAFGLAPTQAQHLRGRRVALIDDVMTSGATAAEATRVLLTGGASEVQVWVLARTPLPSEA